MVTWRVPNPGGPGRLSCGGSPAASRIRLPAAAVALETGLRRPANRTLKHFTRLPPPPVE
jgi:hypothetical protein